MNGLSVLAHWDEVRGVLWQALDKLSDEQLAFRPGDGLMSPARQALHIAGCEDGWLRHVLTGELADFPAPYMGTDFPGEDTLTVEVLKTHLAEIHARSAAYLAPLGLADLERIVETAWGQTYTVYEVFRYVIAHELHHRGEVFLTLGLLGLEAPGF